jgi:hypothetical protein
LRLVQELRGNQQFWLAVLPVLAPYLSATDALLAGADAQGNARPRGSDVARERAFREFWEAIDLQRVLVSTRSQWEVRFQHPLVGSLTPAERLALPGASASVVWVTGDATLTRLAAVDWTNKVALVSEVQPYLEPLRAMLRAAEEGAPQRGPLTCEEEDLLIIAITELMTLVCFAAERADAWAGKLVLYVGDNRNVQQWIESRNAGNP